MWSGSCLPSSTEARGNLKTYKLPDLRSVLIIPFPIYTLKWQNMKTLIIYSVLLGGIYFSIFKSELQHSDKTVLNNFWLGFN